MLQPGKFWADVCRHVGPSGVGHDPRFATVEQLAGQHREAVKLLQEVIASRTLAEWAERFATLAGPVGPRAGHPAGGRDAQVRANEYILPAGELELASSPVQFDVTAPQLRPGPRVRRADRGDPAGARPGLGPHHRPQGSRRRHLTGRFPPLPPHRPVPPVAASPAGSPRRHLTGRFPPPSPHRPVPPAVTSPAGSPRRHLTGRCGTPFPRSATLIRLTGRLTVEDPA